jgi:hypothetical protein
MPNFGKRHMLMLQYVLDHLNDSARYRQFIKRVNASLPGGKLSNVVFLRIEWHAVTEQPFMNDGFTRLNLGDT